MKHIKLFGLIVGLTSLGIILGLSLNLFNSFPSKDDHTPIVGDAHQPQPPAIFNSSYAYLPFETMIKEAEVIVAGKVIAIGETRWNQDSGQYWEETFPSNGYETVVSALPYYEITMSVDHLLADSLGVKDSQLVIIVIGPSPIDHQAEASSIHPKSGDDIVAFVGQGEIGWRSGQITYNKDDGSLETGRKAALLLMGGPDNSHLLKNADNLYDRPSAKDSPYPPAEELTAPISLETLAKMVQEKRAASQ